MKFKWFIILLFYSWCSLIFSQEVVTRADGSKVILYSDHTWSEKKDDLSNKPEQLLASYKNLLRPGVKATLDQTQTACEMLAQGWKYTMPVPKSAQAAWGNGDGRTTWYNGYWYNSKTNFLYHCSIGQLEKIQEWLAWQRGCSCWNTANFLKALNY